ncbi:hypothetical protein D9M72_595170 [compost metagenome]
MKYSVVWNLTPLRRWNVYVRPSSLMSQDSASAGITSVVPGLKSARRLKMVSATASAVTAVVYWTMSKPSGLFSVQTTKGLAETPTATLSKAAAMAARRGSIFIKNPLQSVKGQKPNGRFVIESAVRRAHYRMLNGTVVTRRNSLMLPSAWFSLAR